jgi:hypothetical protein
MPCCQGQEFDRMFDARRARKELLAYTGPPDSASVRSKTSAGGGATAKEHEVLFA